jgi:hypothetical protein
VLSSLALDSQFLKLKAHVTELFSSGGAALAIYGIMDSRFEPYINRITSIC